MICAYEGRHMCMCVVWVCVGVRGWLLRVGSPLLLWVLGTELKSSGLRDAFTPWASFTDQLSQTHETASQSLLAGNLPLSRIPGPEQLSESLVQATITLETCILHVWKNSTTWIMVSSSTGNTGSSGRGLAIFTTALVDSECLGGRTWEDVSLWSWFRVGNLCCGTVS